jgi:hypothetical protein|tara:strand:+ start:2048 stop:2167 length:120 start_codon:yes stop_codon:yes gene_type:complete
MDNRINDIKLGATVVVGILTIYLVWTTYNGFKGSSLEKE